MQDLGIISPSLEEFRERAVTHRVIPVCIKILADSLTPIGIYRSLVLHDGAADPGTFCLNRLRSRPRGIGSLGPVFFYRRFFSFNPDHTRRQDTLARANSGGSPNRRRPR